MPAADPSRAAAVVGDGVESSIPTASGILSPSTDVQLGGRISRVWTVAAAWTASVVF